VLGLRVGALCGNVGASEPVMNIDLALVTGAGRGIGRSIAQTVGRQGVHTLCISRTDTCLATAASILESGGSAEAAVIDIADMDACEEIICSLVSRHQPQRVGIVLAAAILGSPGGLVGGPPLGEWGRVFGTNVLGNLAVLKGCLPRMRETRFGRVVALAGGGAAYAYPEFSAYALSKAALVRAIENLDAEFAELGDFSFVALAPGAIDTDMLATVRAAGGTVHTVAKMDEPLSFVSAFFTNDATRLSGRFVHVRDDWRAQLSGSSDKLPVDHWKLRRIQ
jgi:NAD(P)-dependent dehydrogenase (short-subunit alcohol dehydrogenase family)